VVLDLSVIQNHLSLSKIGLSGKETTLSSLDYDSMQNTKLKGIIFKESMRVQ